MTLNSLDWVREHAHLRGFDHVFKFHVEILAEHGDDIEVDMLLDSYQETVPAKDARYINYCDMRCHAYWVRGDYEAAIKWGKAGRDLKLASSVDTKSDVEHNLSLAERDAGRPEAALPFFLAGRSLADVTNPDELDEARDGSHYGNIGRCLHLMGQIEQALVCYQKSAILLEKNVAIENVLNQGFVRAWVAELLVAREQFRLANVFFRAAYRKWVQVSPPRAARVLTQSRQIGDRVAPEGLAADKAIEAICRDWISGRDLDKELK